MVWCSELYGVVWFCLVWCGAVRCSVVRCCGGKVMTHGVVWQDVVCCVMLFGVV